MKGVSDLNGEEQFWQSSDFSSRGCHEHRQNAVRSTHGLPPLEDFPSHCRSLRRRSLRKVYDSRRSIPRAFAQLTYRESLRDIEVCLSAQSAKLYLMGLRQETKRWPMPTRRAIGVSTPNSPSD